VGKSYLFSDCINTKEIGGIGGRKGGFIYIRVALKLEDEATIKREFENLLEIDNIYPKYLITNSQFNGNTYQGIQHVYIREF